MSRTPVFAVLSVTAATLAATGEQLPYAVVDTGQQAFYDNHRNIPQPAADSPLAGQDAGHPGNQPAYRDNGDGTVSDRVTGLTWQQDPGEKVTWRQARDGAAACRLGGHEDWRLPTIKELYSLILFSGIDPDPQASDTGSLRPFIDTRHFRFRYGDPAAGERIIDSQFASATKYVSTTMRGDETVFGVNFADGRIKGYGLRHPRTGGEKTFHVLYVRGNPDYGRNDLHDNGDGTVTDRATGLTWMKVDSGHLGAGPDADGRMNWQRALEWADELEFAGHSDWRLPDAKELQTIVDYSRSPANTGSAAIDPVFDCSTLTNEGGERDFPCYWTSTTHARGRGGEAAVYIAFGRASGWMQFPPGRGPHQFLDVHGAGAQRSDPKTGDPADFPRGRGPQGDVIRILNHVRCVRGGTPSPAATTPADAGAPSPLPEAPDRRDAGAPVPPHFRRLDTDRDGKVSRGEFDGPPRAFDRHDRDGDGFLGPDEFPKGPPR